MNAKKFLSILLSVAMIASMAVVSMAAEMTEDVLQEALNEGGTVKLTGPVTVVNGLHVEAGVTVTLDLAGYSISQTKAQTAGYQMLLNDGNLTIMDSVGGGKLSYTDSGNGGEYISDTIYNRAVLIIDGGTIENISSSTVASNGYPQAVDTYSGLRDTSVTINGGTIYCAEYSAIRMFCVSATNKADLIINGGTIKGAVDMQNGTKVSALGSLTVNGGDFETTANVNNIRFANWNGGATEYGISASIEGGSFDGGFTKTYVPEAANWDSKIVTGGTFANDPSAYVAKGYVAVEKNGAYKVVKETNIKVEDINASIDLTVKDEEGKKAGSVTKNDDESHDIAVPEDGFYIIEIKDDSGATKNILAEVVDGELKVEEAEVTAPDAKVKSEVDSSLTSLPVGGAAAEAAKISEDNGYVPVTVTTTIAAATISTNDEAQNSIKAEATESDNLYFLDITPTAVITADEGTKTKKLENTSTIFKIVIPFEAAEAESVVVYRYHDGKAEKMAAYNGSGEGFEYKNGYVVIYSQNFSTYAIGYSAASGTATAGGSGIILEGPFVYESDDDTMREADGFKTGDNVIEYGEPLYYLIVDETLANGPIEGAPLDNKIYTEKLKVKAAWNMGESAVESVQVVKKYVNVDAAANECDTIGESGYYYFLEIVTADKKTISDTDVAGVIRFDRKANSKKGVEKIDECKIDVDFSVFYPNTWLSNNEIKEDRANIEFDTPYVLKFNYDDEVELSFGSANGGNNEGTFTVDVSGQGKIYLEYTTEADEAIAAANEGAKLDFLTFNGLNGVGVKFNRTGEFRYEMDDAAYAYRVVDGKLAEIAGLEVEDDEFIFNTNRLEAYVFSDTELVDPA